MKIQQNPKVAWRTLGEEAFLVTPWDSSVHQLSSVGTRIWEIIEKPATREELLTKLCDEYDVTVQQAKKDLTDFLQEMEKRKLIELTD